MGRRGTSIHMSAESVGEARVLSALTSDECILSMSETTGTSLCLHCLNDRSCSFRQWVAL